MINKNLLIEAGINYIYQLDTFDKEAVRKQVSIELEDILSLNDDEVLLRRLDYVGIGKKEVYLNQWIETSEGYVLAGIRHMGGNLLEPFVYLWPTFKIKDVEGVIKDLEPYFEKFKPKYYNFWIRPDMNDYDCSIIQQRFIGLVEDMVKCDLPLEKPDEYYEWYENEYAKFHDEFPEFKNRVMINDREMMDHCLSQDLLFTMNIDNQRVGLIAAEREEFLGEPSVYIDEILIGKEFRGKGYGSKLLGSFVSHINYKYLICHIDSENISSTKTALRAGEKIFSQECLFKV